MTEFSKLQLFWGKSTEQWVVLDNNDPGVNALFFTSYEDALQELRIRTERYTAPLSAEDVVEQLLLMHSKQRVWNEWGGDWSYPCAVCHAETWPCTTYRSLSETVKPTLNLLLREEKNWQL